MPFTPGMCFVLRMAVGIGLVVGSLNSTFTAFYVHSEANARATP
jgi:hypothetical protein